MSTRNHIYNGERSSREEVIRLRTLDRCHLKIFDWEESRLMEGSYRNGQGVSEGELSKNGALLIIGDGFEEIFNIKQSMRWK